jgi:uncharacterized protein YndB with AHSA1/START domain
MASPAFLITEEFSVPVQRMFELWTDPQHLQRWFGPIGMTMDAHTLDLRPNGHYHFGLKVPSGQVMWGRWDFLAVQAPRQLQWLHAFSDDQGGLTRHPMIPNWPLQLETTVTFEPSKDGTTLSLQWTPHQATEAEQAVFDLSHQGMRMGWQGTFGQLRQYAAGLATP